MISSDYMIGAVGAVWRIWLKVAEVLANLQLALLLTLFYWTLWALVAIPFKLLADPLSLRQSVRTRWVDRAPVSPTLESMRKQG